MIKILSLFGLLCIVFSSLNAKDEQVYESQPNILFKQKELLHIEQSISLETDFNNAVLYLEQEEYLKAINLFKKTAKILKIPSFLNIGIAYYKLGSTSNAYLYLKKIYDFKEASREDSYSYISASYYLYRITNDRNFISSIITTAQKIPPKKNRQIDMIFYFAPFIFVDKKEIYNDATLGFVLKNKDNIEALDMMIDYNKKFVDIVKLDPIVRTIKLQEMIDAKLDVKSYEYYNLALSYAHNFDFRNAHKYFKKAYDLSRSNKLYAAMTMISAKRGDIFIQKDTFEKIKSNLLANDGTYKYLGKYIYKLTYDNKSILDGKSLSLYDRKSIFLRALSFLEKMKSGELSENEPLLEADVKDPMVFLFRSLVKRKNESQYNYISRLQDSMPKTYNDYFLKGPALITQYYIEVVKSLGVFKKIDFDIKNERTPSYLRTKAIVQLYDGFPKATIKIMELLRNEYKINDIYTMDLLIAAYLSAGDESNALAKLGELQFEFNDKNAKFISAVQLLQNLKTNSAAGLFATKYDGFFIDFEMQKLDDFLESL
ncbi:MAG: hypothetical protein HY307_03395 [Arcobacter sp.]|nr:hypothetical protein [Arcobacter sp.]